MAVTDLVFLKGSFDFMTLAVHTSLTAVERFPPKEMHVVGSNGTGEGQLNILNSINKHL